MALRWHRKAALGQRLDLSVWFSFDELSILSWVLLFFIYSALSAIVLLNVLVVITGTLDIAARRSRTTSTGLA
jgi:hypothetical protein